MNIHIKAHTCKNLIPMVVTRAMANSSKNHALLYNNGEPITNL